MATMLTRDLAQDFATLALGHVSRPYPYSPGHVLDGPDDVAEPRTLHPVFFGSFDWHSCVHAFWLLARLLRRHPDVEAAGAIRALFDARLTPDAVAAECATLARPSMRGFERPYGWAWLLKLAAELRACAPRGREPAWAAALAPLADAMAGRFMAFLPLATYPVRAGTHGNTAFALRLAADYAATADPALMALIEGSARRLFLDDADCQAWEPGGDDFLSGALIEAECLRRLLPPAEFASWFTRFLPRLSEGEPATLFRPAVATDRTDGKIAHLDGFNLSRAWCWRALAATLPDEHPAHPRIAATIADHRAASLGAVSGAYMGEHWLATFALLALDGA